MKNYLPKLFFVLCIIVGCMSCAYAGEWVPVTKFAGTWEETVSGAGTGIAAAAGATISLAANGSNDGGFNGELFKTDTTGIAGMWAALRVDQVSGNCDLGLKTTIGQLGNKQIQLLIYLTAYNQVKSIQYSIKLVSLMDAKTDLIGSGVFGGWDGTWVAGKPQIVGFARFGSELWFYADGYKQIHKIQLLDGIIPYYGNVSGYVSAPRGDDASIAGSISDVYLYYE